MFLKINGIGKIQDSTIEIKGITVVAGENNTGKSTFGKVLYCMFNAFCNIDKKILDERLDSMHGIISDFLGFDGFGTISIDRKLLEHISELKDSFSADKFREILLNSSDVVTNKDKKKIEEIIQGALDEIKNYVTISSTEIQKSIINRYFRNEFSGQVNHINKPDIPGEISLSIGGKKVQVTLIKNECSNLLDEVGIIHNAIYIDNSLVLDDAGTRNRPFFYYTRNNHHRNNLLSRIVNDGETTAIKEAIIKQKLNNILTIIGSMANGDFISNKNALVFSDHSLQKPIALQNVSTGIKIFLIIKRLLEKNEIKERDVLIFDEPEIHLHPAWQLKFAEILVLLQKEFNLTILLTTHSPYFLHAVEVYSTKYDIKDQTKYYLAENKGDVSEIQDVSKNIDTVYKQLALPFQKLEDVMYGD